jgi:biotin carboxyl carrier protein
MGQGARPLTALRVVVGPATRREDDPSIVVDAAEHEAGDPRVLVDGLAIEARLIRVDSARAKLELGVEGRRVATRVLFGASQRRARDGMLVREVVVDGWRVEVELEPEARAALRARATRSGTVAVTGGPVEVRAIIPGRIVALAVVPGDTVVAGQHLLVLEAMKMQNELRAPRDGVVERVAVGAGENVEVGDILVLIR